MIDRFRFYHHTCAFAILWRLIYFRFNIAVSYDAVFVPLLEKIQFLS